MGREVRIVPANWEHPKDRKGYIPLHSGSFSVALKRWQEGKATWGKGLRRDFDTDEFIPIEDKYKSTPYEEWEGRAPQVEEYMPDWESEKCTHFQMYETCTEGTPISPVMPDRESLAHWLADNKASAFGDMTATYEEWLNTINRGYAIGMVWDSKNGLRPGVSV